MALVDNAWYVNFGNGSSTGYYSVTAWVALTSFDCGALVRQLAAPAVGSERVFVCVAGHVASGAAEPSWTLTRGAKTTDATITWQEATGIAALNGDLSTNTPNWTTVKNTAITLGQVIQNNAGNLILICTTAGTAGNGAEPSWAAYTTAGATTVDNGATWTTLGASFSAWGAPHARLANAFATNWGQAGNKFWVSEDHAETQASNMTLTSPGTAANPCFIYCVNHAGTVPPVSADLRTTATITTTGAFGITFAGSSYYYGVTFSAGSGAVAASIQIGTGAAWNKFESCSLKLSGTAASNISTTNQGANNANRTEWLNTTVQFGNVGSNIALIQSNFIWKGGSITGATIPTTLFTGGGSSLAATAWIEGVNLSALGSGKTIVGAIANPAKFYLKDCALGASVTVSAAQAAPGSAEIYVLRSDSSGTNYRHEKYQYVGTQTVETTIVRTGGASDGTTPLSWKPVTTANSKWVLPFEALPIAIWNDTSGSPVTVTLYGIWGGGAVPNNDDIWMDVEYLGASGNPQGSFISASKADNLAAGVALSSDTSTWGGSTTKFKMSVTFTPQQKGSIYVYVKAAKVSSTFYIDPKPVLS